MKVYIVWYSDQPYMEYIVKIFSTAEAAGRYKNSLPESTRKYHYIEEKEVEE